MIKLFYSYCHEDETFRDDIEKHLAVLRKKNLIREWHDRKILPGSKWEGEIETHMRSSQIILLLISSDFLASSSCEEEIERSLQLSEDRGVTVIPIVLRPCSWQDDERIGELQVLPTDGKAVEDWPSRDKAFLNIFEGIKDVVKSMEFKVQPDFRSKVTQIEFISQNKEDIELDDIFVFPNIIYLTERRNYRILRLEGLWKAGNRVILKGEERSGKTIICRKLFLECVSKNIPVVMLQGEEIRSPKNHDLLIENSFNRQFYGDYIQWKKRKDKTIIIDNFNFDSRMEFVEFAEEHFDHIFISTSKDDYLSYFRDQKKFANYGLLTIGPFKRSQQENLIKHWKSLGNHPEVEAKTFEHGEIDQIENSLDSIILNNKIVPRFPFFILSILQVHEEFMPKDMRITTYGHCYQALITAQLIKIGIQAEDIDSAYNFLTRFAFDIFSRDEEYSTADFEEFLNKYQDQFLIGESVVNRLTRGKFVEVGQNGKRPLRYSFIYYFFLGKFFAENYSEYGKTIEQLVEESYLRDNRYILIFMIHHTSKENLEDFIKTISRHTSTVMRDWPAAKLTADETKRLASSLKEIPQRIISSKPVEENRREERNLKDKKEAVESDALHENQEVNPLYKALKNMEILGQILKNKYGSSTKDKLREIVTIITDVGLRSITMLTGDESIRRFEDLLREAKDSDVDHDIIEMTSRVFRFLCFLTIGGAIDKIADCIQKRELEEIVIDICDKENTPAYDLIDFFFVLRTATKLQDENVEKLKTLLKKFAKDRNEIAERLLSFDMQIYLNTHDVNYRLRQKICEALGEPEDRPMPEL